ncbi:hypothetical protein LguiA_019135 [Lonicera macranthoides]
MSITKTRLVLISKSFVISLINRFLLLFPPFSSFPFPLLFDFLFRFLYLFEKLPFDLIIQAIDLPIVQWLLMVFTQTFIN